MRARNVFIGLVFGIMLVLNLSLAEAGQTINKIRSTGLVHCGISEETAGFSFKDKNGRWQGLSVDFCRAVATAVLGNGEKVTFVPLITSSRFPVLLSGKIDLLAHITTMTFGREAGIGVRFPGVYFYDGQTFMVPRKSKIRKIENMNRAIICVKKGATHKANLEIAFQAKGLTYKPLVIDSLPEMKEAFFSGRCEVYTGDRSVLAGVQSSVPGGLNQFQILSENISKEPLGPVVRSDDEEWFALVRWVLLALVEAEERGVTSKNVRTLQKTSSDPGLSQFLNYSGNLGKGLGLKPEWVADVIAQVGNYGEIYERNFGDQSSLKIERGLNRLWTKGGLLYAPPFQ